MRIFNAYVTSAFMYNSELWGMTATLEKEIDVFHRKLLRQILKIKWPYIITNEAVYDRTKEIKWSQKIKKRRLASTGHMKMHQ